MKKRLIAMISALALAVTTLGTVAMAADTDRKDTAAAAEENSPDITATDGIRDVQDYILGNLDSSLIKKKEEISLFSARSFRASSSAGLTDTGRRMVAKYTIGRADNIPEGTTIEDVYASDEQMLDTLLSQYISLVSVYETSTESDYYVAFFDTTILNGVGNVTDCVFAEGNTDGEEVEDIVFDYDTGIAYIPKTCYEDEDGEAYEHLVQAQLLVAYDEAAGRGSKIQVSVHSSDSSIRPIAEYYEMETDSIWDTLLEIPLAAPGTDISLDNIEVQLNGCEGLFNLSEGETASYDPSTGKLTILANAVTVATVEVNIKKENLLSKLQSFFVLDAKAATTSDIWQWDECIRSDIELVPGTEVARGQVDFAYGDTVAQQASAFPNYIYGWTDDKLQQMYAYMISGNATSAGVGNTLTIGSSLYLTYMINIASLGITEAGNDGLVFLQCAHITSPFSTAAGSANKIEVRIYCLEVGPDYAILGFVTAQHWTQTGMGVLRFGYNRNGSIELHKVSETTSLTNFNSCYSLKGAEFGVYQGSTLVGTIVTDETGYGRLDNLKPGSYTVKETKASPGYAINLSSTPTVTVTAGKSTAVTIKETPQNDPVDIMLHKVDSETDSGEPQGNMSLAGAQFLVCFYLGDKAPDTCGPSRYWILETDEDGYCQLLDKYKVSGSDFYTIGGQPTLPLGTITIREIKAPEGYQLNPEVYTVKITGDGTSQTVETYNAPTIPETPLKLNVLKLLQGTDAAIPGAVFKHTLPDGTTEELTTDENGEANVVGLAYGQHTLEEIEAPEGYALNPGKLTFTVSNRESRIQYYGHQQTFGNLPNAVDGEITGIIGEAKQMEAFTINKGAVLEGISGEITYRAHCQGYGWMDWVTSGKLAGTSGESKRLEAIQISLTGELAEQYDIYYRTHIQTYGWLQWVKGSTNDTSWSGSSGLSKSIQAIQIVMVPKGEAGPDNSENSRTYSYMNADGGYSQSYKGQPLTDIQAETRGTDITLDSNTSKQATGLMTFTVSADGSAANVTVEDPISPYKLSITKKDDSGTVLADAEFALYSDADCKKEVAAGKTDANGKLQFTNLEAGKTYYLKETKAPEGYRLPVDADGKEAVYKIVAQNSEQGEFECYVNEKLHKEVTVTEAERIVNMTIVNHPGLELPETGSHLPLLLFLAGIGLMAVVVIYHLRRKEKGIEKL